MGTSVGVAGGSLAESHWLIFQKLIDECSGTVDLAVTHHIPLGSITGRSTGFPDVRLAVRFGP